MVMIRLIEETHRQRFWGFCIFAGLLFQFVLPALAGQEVSKLDERTDRLKPEVQIAEAKEGISKLKERITQLRNESKWVEAMPLTEKFVAATERVHGEKSAEMAEALHDWAW